MRYKLHTTNDDYVELLLFRNVSNAKHILDRMLQGEFSAAFLQARLIPDVFLPLVAASKAVRDVQDGSMSTRNLFTEIVYNMSASRNISKALKTFGIRENTTQMLVLIPHPKSSEIDNIRDAIKGEQVPLTDSGVLHEFDDDAVKRIYGISEKELACGTFVDSIVTRMACRDVK